MLQIPLRPNPNQRLQIILANQECTIHLYQKGKRMYLNLDIDAERVCSAAICQNQARIVQNAQYAFEGELIFFDTLGDTAPQYHLLNSRYFLIYFSVDDPIRPYKP